MKIALVIIAVAAVSVIFASSVPAADWWENVKLKGDFRYRHEMLDTDNTEARLRHCIRARLGIFESVSTNTRIGIQLATGSDNPVSTNQTIGDGNTTKSVGLDLAFMETTHEKLPGLILLAGKMKNPFYRPGKSELLWDSDWNPEGAALAFEHSSDHVSVDLITGGMWLQERKEGRDNYMAALQGKATFQFQSIASSLTVGGGIFDYDAIKDYEPLYNGDGFGNSLYTVVDTLVDGDDSSFVSTEYYSGDYTIIELFASATHELGSFPVTVLGDVAVNSEADSLDTGWLIGCRAGKTGKPGSWELQYNYRKIEKDAVFGLFTSSGFRGGGTDAKGHDISAALQLAKNTTFKVTYYITEANLTQETTDAIRRFHMDLQLKF